MSRNECRILLVEDTAALRLLHATLLARAGHQVVTARDGAEAVIEAARHRFDLILMDLDMPVMDGFRAALLIRTGGGLNAGTPIVAFTASGADLERCRSFGIDGVLAKPCSPLCLGQAVLEHRCSARCGKGALCIPEVFEPCRDGRPGRAGAGVAAPEGIAPRLH